jgi:uncharacterized membrane protein
VFLLGAKASNQIKISALNIYVWRQRGSIVALIYMVHSEVHSAIVGRRTNFLHIDALFQCISVFHYIISWVIYFICSNIYSLLNGHNLDSTNSWFAPVAPILYDRSRMLICVSIWLISVEYIWSLNCDKLKCVFCIKCISCVCKFIWRFGRIYIM